MLIVLSQRMRWTRSTFIATLLAIVTIVPSTVLSFPGDSLFVQWWHAIASEMTSSSDIPFAVTTDAAGNTIVTGWSEGVGSAFDIFTIKYDPQGTVVWSQRYDGWDRGFDIPSAIAVDHDGNVIVTGTSDGSDSSETDIVTIKYSSTGHLQWIVRYDAPPSNSFDAAVDVAIDGNGSVYVCGVQSRLSREIVTIKYSPDGFQEWANAFGGNSYGPDNPVALTADEQGNAYVACTLSDTLSGSGEWVQNMAVIKYSSYGQKLWNQRYQSSGFWTGGKDVVATGKDAVYVTGDRWSWSYPTGWRSDIVTARYSSTGVPEWVDIFDAAEIPMSSSSPRDVAAQLDKDEQGNVYVAGGVSHRLWESAPDSIVTIKYSPLGSRVWVRYLSKGSSRDIRSGGLACGTDGSVFVLGFKGDYTLYADSTIFARYGPTGSMIWQRSAPVSYWQPQSTGGFAVDGAGNSVIISPTESQPWESGQWSNFGLRSYSSTGGERWTAETDGGGSCISFVRDAVADAGGNTIVTGAFVDSTGLRDFFTAKYDPTGQQTWYRTFGGVTGGDDGAFAATNDSYGNVYVTGSSEGVGYDKDYLTIKYNSAGVEQWSERFHSSMNDRAYHVQVDAEGNVVVAGYPSLVKYDPSGLLLWSVNTGDYPVSAMALDNSGSIFLANQGEELLRKYNSDGGLLWSTFSEAVDLAVGDDGSVFTSWALGTTKYDADGGMMWQKPVEGGNWVRVENGRVIVGGYDSLFVLTEEGVVQWRRPGLLSLIRNGDVAAVGHDGSIYLSGMELDAEDGPTGRLHVVQYSSDGDLLRSGVYDDMGRAEFRPFYLSPDEHGNVFIVGERTGNDYSTTPFVVRLSRFGLSITDVSPETGPDRFALHQNYPNPFNPQTRIAYSVGSPQSTVVRVYDVLGREIATLVNERKEAGTHIVTWDASGLPSGVYFYRLTAGSFSETRKLMLVR